MTLIFKTVQTYENKKNEKRFTENQIPPIVSDFDTGKLVHARVECGGGWLAGRVQRRKPPALRNPQKAQELAASSYRSR